MLHGSWLLLFIILAEFSFEVTMGIADWIAIIMIAIAVFCAVYYMIKKKKDGCIGCPYSEECKKNERNGCK